MRQPLADVLGLAEHLGGLGQRPHLEHARLAGHDGEVRPQEQARLISVWLPGPSATMKSASSRSLGNSLRTSSGVSSLRARISGHAWRIHSEDERWVSQSARMTRWPCS